MLQAPSVVRRAADPAALDLSPYELAVRDARQQVLEQLGGIAALAPTKVWQVDALISRWIVKEMLDLDVHRLAISGKLVNLDQRSRRTHPLLGDWLKVMQGFEAALKDVGVTPVKAKPLDLAEEARLAVLEEEAKRRARAEQPAGRDQGAGSSETNGTEPPAPVARPGAAVVACHEPAAPVVVTPLSLRPGTPDLPGDGARSSLSPEPAGEEITIEF